ncbi:MAG UNVERIFIED_CONTAM: apolipoprotein N-acyltransferase [Rickettsiaceae bacterium]
MVYLIHSANSLKEAVRRNIAFSFGYFGYGFYWTTIAISIYIEDFWWAIPIAFLGLPLIFVLFTSLIIIPIWHLRASKHYVMIFTILWVFIEWLTSWIFTGLPWMLVGYSAGFSDILSQFASIAGIFGLSLVILNLAATFYYALDYKKTILKADRLYFAFVAIIIIIFGISRLSSNPLELTDIRIRIVQPSIKQGEKWEPEAFWKNLGLHSQLSKLPTIRKPDIILWSEAAIPAPYHIEIVSKYLKAIASDMKAILISGAIASDKGKFYTSLVAIDKNDVIFDYHKKHLVPFGEYVPLKQFLPIKKLTSGLADYSPGTGDKIFEIKSLKLKIRPMICYESIFPEEIRTKDADLLVNITNSSWYGKSTAPYHLFYVNKFRAIENSTPVVVSANNGISGVFDSMGRIISHTNLNDTTSLDAYIPQRVIGFTPYSAYGLYLSLMIVIFLQGLQTFL